MTNGIVIMHWNERIGAEITGAYPPEAQKRIQIKTLMQLYAQHEYTGESGFVYLTVADLNLVSYYTGPETKYYLVLSLDEDEEGTDFEEGILTITREFMDIADDLDKVKDFLPELFKQVSSFPYFTEEQKLGVFFRDEVKKKIIERFRNEMMVARSDIELWVKQNFDIYVDIEALLDQLMDMGLVKTVSVKGISSDMMFFVQDIMMLRHPPIDIVKKPGDFNIPDSLHKFYVAEVRKFFKSYILSDADNMKIVRNIVTNIDTYNILQLLRHSAMTMGELKSRLNLKEKELGALLKKFWELQMIAVLEDKHKVEFYCLISDFYISKFYPTYNIDTIIESYKNKVQGKKVLLKALDLMREEYYIQHNLAKKKAKEKKKEDDEGVPKVKQLPATPSFAS
ncbi:MAG: hypothetical protein GF364_14450 [Candidatus Lokiarchaeota archaeon]|nr:hypothetical protein [Candidatus Lokiarchaeota archaeon]